MITVRDVSDDDDNSVVFRDADGDTFSVAACDGYIEVSVGDDERALTVHLETPAQLTRIANELLRIAKECEEKWA